MRDIPELTFRGALSVLGEYDRPVLERLNAALGGVIMVGGTVALAGPAATPLGALAAVWGWVDQKNEALDLVRKLLDKVAERRAAARGYDRTRLVAAAHTIIVASAVVDAFRRAVGEKAFKALEITEKELSTLLARTGDGGRKAAEAIYDSTVPMPSSGRGFQENLNAVSEWQERFATALVDFCGGLRAGDVVSHVNASLVGSGALHGYEEQYRRLAAQVPEFGVWAMLNEHAATRGVVAQVHEGVAAQTHAMVRLESLLAEVHGAAPDQVSALRKAVRAGLDEPVVPRDASTMSFLADVRIPLVREIFVQPTYRCERAGARSRVADEQWWRTLPVHEDLDVRVAAHLTSAEATRLPLLVLGHPGAGKSLLMKVLAARLPADQYTTVYVPLRHVSGTASVHQQVEEALARETNGRAGWAGLVNQSKATTMVILLDGLDEMLQAADRDRASYLHEVAEFQWREAIQERPVVVLVTSRTLVADRVDVPLRSTVVKLEEFSTGQIAQWRDAWNAVNRDAIAAGTVRELTHEAIVGQRELARQPLLLLMLALYSADLSSPAIESGLSRTSLYQTLFDNFTRREATKLPDTASPRDQLQRLSVAALGMFNRGRQYVTDVELAADLAALAPGLGEMRRTDRDQRLVAQFFFVHTSETDLDTDRARRSYEFLHATFGEYLVAREIVETLVDTADSAVGRHGTREPDDARLFALLSHDCLAVRGPILDFIGDLLTSLPVVDKEQMWGTFLTLLAEARRRHGSSRYSDYRPTRTDHIREIAAYTANLVLLALLVEREEDIMIEELIGGTAIWRSTLDLWRSGLATDSWYSLLATIEREAGGLSLSTERTRSTALDAELRHAELAADTERVNTLWMGRTIRESAQESAYVLEPVMLDDEEKEELLGWVTAVLAFGAEPAERPMHEDRLDELFHAIADQDFLDLINPMIAMVLKQRSERLSPEVAKGLLTFLLREEYDDTYAFIAAAGSHPGLLTELPELMEPAHYVGMQGVPLMIQGTMEVMPESRVRFTHLLNLIKKAEGKESDESAAALLDAFQWRLES
jgi:NACHT conflict system protein/AAA domain-containing protein